MARIRRFGILSTATFMGLFGVIFGLIAAILMGIFQFILSNFVSLSEMEYMVIQGIGYNWLSLLFPLIYGAGMFIGGLIFTPITNLILKIIGGLEVDIINK